MIEITRDGTKVTAKIDLNVPLYETRRFAFHFETGSEWAAGLLAKAMRDQINDAVRQARAEEYEAGWKDAKSHKKDAKRDYFTGRLIK